jgi:4-hydroxymandelate oxidase
VGADVNAEALVPGDFESLARARLDAPTWAWLAGGAADEISLRGNRAAWDALPLWPHVLRPLREAHTRSELLGRTLAVPLLLAPVAYQRLLHPLGEAGSALAAATQGAGVVLCALSSVAMEEVARHVLAEPARGPLWFQLYLSGDRGFDLALVQRAEAAGFEALVLTVDAAVQGARDHERRAGFRPPEGITAVHFAGAPPLPHDPAAICGGLLARAPTWDDVAWLRERTRLPLLLKGVLRADDARQAAALGVAGLVVSNHGGRTLDTVTPTAAALPRIADALGGALPLLVDGGIRRGTDVLKAVALGASAVLVGRAPLFALAAAGPQGVAQALRWLRDELEIALALSGCASLAQASRALLEAPR